MSKFNKYIKLAKSKGVDKAMIIDPKTVVVSNWVRLKCQYGCGGYGKSLTCPPHSPTPDYTGKMLAEYSSGLLMQAVGLDLYNDPRISMEEIVADLEKIIFLDGYYKAFGLAAGPCDFCRACDTSKPCLHPEKARPAMEACGIDVYQTVRNNGLKLEVVRSEKDLCSIVSLLLIE